MNSTNTLKDTRSLFIKPIVTILLLLVGHYFVAAQPNPMTDLLAFNEPTTVTESWSFLSGDDKTYYIDFEELQVKLEEVQVKNVSGKTVFSDNVNDLSSLTLYELDLSKYKEGDYFLELKLKNKKLRKLIHLK